MVSQRFRESAYDRETEDVWLVLVHLSHADLLEDIYVVNNLEDVISNGQLHKACPFEVILPTDTDEGPPVARVRIDNVAQDVTVSLRLIDTPAFIDFKVVLASDPDTVEAEYSGMTLKDVTVNINTISGSVGLDDLRLEPFPAHSFGPSFFPGAF